MGKYIGQPISHYDGFGHVTGTTMYVDDVEYPGMLYVKVLRSPVHKGIIKNIDLSAAENMPGVAGIMTAKDVPGSKIYGPPDQPVFVEKNIRQRASGLLRWRRSTKIQPRKRSKRSSWISKSRPPFSTRSKP